MSSVLAVDFGGTKTTIARVDRGGRVRDRRKMPAARTLEESVGQVADNLGDVSAVGLIVPGIYTPSTGSAWCPNLWGTEDVPSLSMPTGTRTRSRSRVSSAANFAAVAALSVLARHASASPGP